MTSFKITFKDGRNTLYDQTLDQIIAFKIANLTDNSFVISEDTDEKPVKPKKEKELNLDELKNKFISSLTPAQYNDVHLGIKEIKYSSKVGYYLKTIKSPTTNEIHHSTEYLKSKRHQEIKNTLKDFLIQEISTAGNWGYTREELLEVANKL